MPIDQTGAIKITQLRLCDSKTLTPSDLTNGVFIGELQDDSSISPSIELEDGMVVSGIDIHDGGMSIINGSDLGDGSYLYFRCYNGSATIKHNDSSVNPSLRILSSDSSDIIIGNEFVPIRYQSSSGGWFAVSAFKKKPILTSSSNAPSSILGLPIIYTATADFDDCKWIMIDDDGTGIEIGYDSGIMSGGDGAPQGDYALRLRTACNFGISDEIVISWTVT